jgi:hypothetical protein
LKLKKYHTLTALTVFVTACQLLSPEAHAKSVNLTGNWRAYFSGSDAEGADSGMTQFQQRYDANWSPLITRQIRMSADMGYTNSWFQDLGTRETVNPTLRLDVFNDIFSFDLAGYATRSNQSYSTSSETYAWDSSIDSAWEHALWPTLSLRFGQSWEERTSQGHFTGISERSSREGNDSRYDYGGASVRWEGYKFNLFYDYFRSDNEEMGGRSLQEEEDHLGQLRYADNYLNNRVNFSFSQTVGQYNSDVSSEGENASIRVLLSSAYAGDDYTPSSGRLAQNQLLLDGNFDARAYTIKLQQPANLAVRTDFRTVDQIYVYTTKDSNLLVANTTTVTWDLYSSTDGFSWQRVAERVPSVYNRDEFRFEVTTGTVRAAYLKLVATGWLPTVNIEVTELEARSFLTGGEEGKYATTSNQYKTEAFLGIVPLETTHFTYTFSRDENETTGTRDESQTEQLAHTARFSWDYSRYFSPSLGFSTVTNSYTQTVDTESRSYDLIINSIPLPTLDGSVTFSRSEYYEERELEFTTDSISLTTVATLYPDLTSELTLGWSLTEQALTEEQNDSSYIRWALRSRLRKSLTATFTTEYRTSESDTEILTDDHLGHGLSVVRTSGESGSSTLTVSWRPSDILSFSASGVDTWGNEEEADIQALTLSADYLLLRTSKTNVTLNYAFNTSNDDTYNNFGVVWGWNFSRYFTLQTNGYYVISQIENAWNLTTQLTARF